MPARSACPARASLTALVLPLVLLAGCSGSAPDPSAGTTTASASFRASASDPIQTQTPAPAETATASSTVSSLPVIATHKGAAWVDGSSPHVTLNSVVAAAGLLTVTFSVRSDAAEPWSVGSYFYSGDPSSSAADRAVGAFEPVVDGVYVLDPRAKKRYLPARDSDGRCVCSSHLSSLVPPGSAVVLEVVFAAPPAGTRTVDVVIPRVPTFAKVPVTTG